jgi:hypothetical protein
MNFLAGVNRVLRANGIIRGDTDAVSTFSDLQHGATLNLAILAIQDELNELVADQVIAYEHDNTGSIVTIAGIRSYSLPSDFIRFFGAGVLLQTDSKNNITEYPGGEARLMLDYASDYKTTQSTPIHWYFDLTTSKKIAFWPVPSAAITYTFDYEQDVSVSSASDTLPFHTESEAQQFCRLASRRFKMLFEGMDPALIAGDPEHMKAKATLFALMKGVNPSNRWAPAYR